MKKIVVIVAAVMLMTGCRNLEVGDMFYPEASYMAVDKEASFSVRVARDAAETPRDMEQTFRTKAAENCFKYTAREVLQLQPLLRGSHSSADHLDVKLLNFRGAIKPTQVPLTGDMMHDFHCTMSIVSHFDLAGEVVALEDERTISARGGRLTLMLFRDHPIETPAYFVIGRKTSEHGMNLVSIFGSGKIIQIVGMLNEKDSNKEMVLAQGFVLETNHEVLKNDLIFLTMLNVNAAQVVTRDNHQAAPVGLFEDEIRVRPEIRESDSEAYPFFEEMK